MVRGAGAGFSALGVVGFDGYRSAAGVFGDPTWAIEQVGGDVIVIWDSENWPDWRIFDAGHHEVSAEDASYTRRGMAYWSEQSPNLRHVFIPYYCLVFGYVAVWVGLLIWRKRKYEKRLVR